MKVIGYTVSAPSAPYVTSATASSAAVMRLQSSLFRAGQCDDLYISGFDFGRPVSDFMAHPPNDQEDSSETLRSHYLRALRTLQLLASSSIADPALLGEGTAVLSPLDADMNPLNLTYLQTEFMARQVSVAPPPLSPAFTSVERIRSYLRAFLATDLAFVETLFACLRTELLLPSSSASSWRAIADGRSVRLFFPAGASTAREALFEGNPDLSLQVVCFVSERRPVHECGVEDLDAVRACWAADAALVGRLHGETVLAYCTGERERGGDWGNILIFSPTVSFDDGSAIFNEEEGEGGDSSFGGCPHSMRRRKVHEVAISDIAPLYYSRIRLHRLTCRGAVLAWNGNIRFVRTVSLQYLRSADGKGAAVQRDVVLWQEDDDPLAEIFHSPNDSESVDASLLERRVVNVNVKVGEQFSLEVVEDGLGEVGARLCSRIARQDLVAHPIVPYINIHSPNWVEEEELLMAEAAYFLVIDRSRQGQIAASLMPTTQWSRQLLPCNSELVLVVPFLDCEGGRALRGFASTATRRCSQSQSVETWLFAVCWAAQRALLSWLRRAQQEVATVDKDEKGLQKALAAKLLDAADCRERLLKLGQRPPKNCSYERARAELLFSVEPLMHDNSSAILEDVASFSLCLNDEDQFNLVPVELNFIIYICNCAAKAVG